MPLNKTVIAFLLFFTSFFISVACFGQLSRSRTHAVIPYNHKTVIAPPGMVYIPGGATRIQYDQSSSDTNGMHMVSLTSFFIDKTEITNQQYRQFVQWVIDSIAIVNYLKDDKYFVKEDKKDADKAAATTPAITPIDTNATALPKDTSAAAMAAASAPKPADTGKMGSSPADSLSPIMDRRINWAKVNHDKIWNPKSEDYGKLAPMLDENGNIKKELFAFSFKYLRVVSTGNQAVKNRKAVIQTLNIYPDETCWAQDLTNSQTDLYVENYFKAPPFDDYPVVGVTWEQARAYAYWRTLNAKTYYNMPDYMKYYSLTYTLPSEAQWVYAAQGFYDMIVAGDSTDMDTVANVVYPSDSTVTPHDSAWVANYVHQHQADTSATAAVQPPVDNTQSDAQDQRREARAARASKKRADERFNYTISDFLLKGKYGGKYDKNAPAGNDPDNPPIDSSAVHFDPNGMLTNFKQDEGDYWEDGSALTLPVMSYAPNEFGLYNMEGNVSEWVMDAYSPSAFSFMSDLNPELLYDADASDSASMKRKVVRGGSFMSNAKSLNPYYRDMELQNVSHCFIGFRCVMQAPEVITKTAATRYKTIRGNPVKGKFNGVRLPEIH